jgi:hypothetical protein
LGEWLQSLFADGFGRDALNNPPEAGATDIVDR